MKSFEVSFNSPQCGYMSVGFESEGTGFHSTTACSPHKNALSEILSGLTSLLNPHLQKESFAVAWSRNPESYDLIFTLSEDIIHFTVIEYSDELRSESTAKTVFSHRGNVHEFCGSFLETFTQLYEDRETDEFEANWKQPFPYADFERFKTAFQAASH